MAPAARSVFRRYSQASQRKPGSPRLRQRVQHQPHRWFARQLDRSIRSCRGKETSGNRPASPASHRPMSPASTQPGIRSASGTSGLFAHLQREIAFFGLSQRESSRRTSRDRQAERGLTCYRELTWLCGGCNRLPGRQNELMEVSFESVSRVAGCSC